MSKQARPQYFDAASVLNHLEAGNTDDLQRDVGDLLRIARCFAEHEAEASAIGIRLSPTAREFLTVTAQIETRLQQASPTECLPRSAEGLLVESTMFREALRIFLESEVKLIASRRLH